ncbi:pollen-specific leucine-rich repeat extensin-like protein 1 [Iris pallida]|uniref:Pollen-specific leucine-rich repeat extensin-like protein 1 n=1 Tax=Iris pallida TaxID=29817 RepID=A0AAX6EC12_IRIPA|nr:pollen-specific leucine-rich repeat extensin-like protein 1 [Iris pallida]
MPPPSRSAVLRPGACPVATSIATVASTGSCPAARRQQPRRRAISATASFWSERARALEPIPVCVGRSAVPPRSPPSAEPPPPSADAALSLPHV